MIILDTINHHYGCFSGKFGDRLEVKGAANSWDIGERLEDIGVADGVTVVEQNHGGESSLAGQKGRYNVRLGVIDVRCVSSRSLMTVVSNHSRATKDINMTYR